MHEAPFHSGIQTKIFLSETHFSHHVYQSGTNFKIAYRGCDVPFPNTVGNKVCDTENNVTSCNFDGGDCCPISVDYPELEVFLGDDSKTCHAGYFFTPLCLYDEGDCDFLREKWPNCPPLNQLVLDDAGAPIVLGNGVCDQGKENIKEYMNDDCGWVFDDCRSRRDRNVKRISQYPNCPLDEMFRIGDG